MAKCVYFYLPPFSFMEGNPVIKGGGELTPLAELFCIFGFLKAKIYEM